MTRSISIAVQCVRCVGTSYKDEGGHVAHERQADLNQRWPMPLALNIHFVSYHHHLVCHQPTGKIQALPPPAAVFVFLQRQQA